jgi:hypothetical protein
VDKAIAGDRVRRSRCRVTVLQISPARDAWGDHDVAGCAEACAAPMLCA